MNLLHPQSDIYSPDGTDPDVALARTTHLCVIAHQDDIEINAYPAVAPAHLPITLTNKCMRFGPKNREKRLGSANTIFSSNSAILAQT
jgi:hypothetical protein